MKLTPSAKLLLEKLKQKHGYFKKWEKLAADGSFFYDNKRLSKELEVSIKTIERAKKQLVSLSKIGIVLGKYKGSATKYLILKSDNLSPSQQYERATICPAKSDNLSCKGSQKVAPSFINNIDNNNGAPLAQLTSQDAPTQNEKKEQWEWIIEGKISVFLVLNWISMSLKDFEIRKNLISKNCSKEEILAVFEYIKSKQNP